MVNPTTRQRVPEPPSDKRVVHSELDHPFDVKPESLTFIPPKDEDEAVKVTIGFIAYHKAVLIIDFRYLSAASKVELDWADLGLDKDAVIGIEEQTVMKKTRRQEFGSNKQSQAFRDDRLVHLHAHEIPDDPA